MGTTIARSKRTATLIALFAICLLVASPFVLLHHSHPKGIADSHCATCALASTAFALPSADCISCASLVELGLHVLENEPIVVNTAPASQNVRAPPAA